LLKLRQNLRVWSEESGTGKLASVYHKSFAAFDYVEMDIQATGDYNLKCSRCEPAEISIRLSSRTHLHKDQRMISYASRNNVSDILSLAANPQALSHLRACHTCLRR